jgi:ParB-like chromosome segregation protein Spo0J
MAIADATLALVGAPGGAVTISLDVIRPGPSLRSGGLNDAHVAALAEVSEGWPPIVVTEDHVLIDGHHRFAAARLLEWDQISAVVFKGSRADAYVEAVRSNIAHGMPLTLSERRSAGREILAVHPAWSDRRIAGSCGLSAKTVKRLREECEASEDCPSAHHARAGRDGRIRPVDARGVRASIIAELERNPDASLRTIASSVGASPETVRSVRKQLRGEGVNLDALPEPSADGDPQTLSLVTRDHRTITAGEDFAFTSREDGVRFAAWFDRSSVPHGDLWEQVDAVPLSRVYLVADEARRRAKFWEDFAEAVEARTRR